MRIQLQGEISCMLHRFLELILLVMEEQAVAQTWGIIIISKPRCTSTPFLSNQVVEIVLFNLKHTQLWKPKLALPNMVRNFITLWWEEDTKEFNINNNNKGMRVLVKLKLSKPRSSLTLNTQTFWKRTWIAKRYFILQKVL